ncbi:MAG: patatin-like phospholipase family protein [Thermodesulfobacteriota bacterium]|nr:patatin-like phospholipase family protein [Thermodesulfobacteriota bacterium]
MLTIRSKLTNYRSFFWFLLLIAALSAGGCTAIGKVANEPVEQLPWGEQRYSNHHYSKQHPTGDTLLLLAFSGGGTRAAALSYGVLEELRDTHYQKNGREVRLLDDVDQISSVSGGSFTAAYYGLFGDQIFDDFKDEFLYKDVQGELSGMILGFFDLLGRLFSSISRTEIAIDYYDKNIFRGKTFADLHEADGPFILINASDLNSQGQFIFIQPQFDFLCSDLSQFKIARAVAASSAVPVLFAPILIERHPDCNYQKPAWLADAEIRAEREGDMRLQETIDSLNYYLDKDNPPYVTLIDGGVTDNLGLRTLLRNVGLSGGAQKVYDRTYKQSPPKQLVVIVVDASTTSETGIGVNSELPSIGDTLTAVTDMQLHLYNTETLALLQQQLMQWAKTTSTTEHPVTPYFINLNITDVEDSEKKIYFNNIPTSFSLEKEQADMLINSARRLLRNNPVYRKLLHELGADASVI